MARATIYTIGHSTHSIDYFLELLKTYKVTCVVDVRSVAASRFNPQYNKLAFAEFLKKNLITYLHFPAEFGARYTSPVLLDKEGCVDFEKVRTSPAFKNGIARLQQGIDKKFVIALMCAESEPLDCHRFSMISPALTDVGFDVKHILKDTTLKTQLELEQDLLKQYSDKIPTPTIFEPAVDALKMAYRLKNKEIGYVSK